MPYGQLKAKPISESTFDMEILWTKFHISKNLIRIQPHHGSDSIRAIYVKTDITTKLVFFSWRLSFDGSVVCCAYNVWKTI